MGTKKWVIFTTPESVRFPKRKSFFSTRASSVFECVKAPISNRLGFAFFPARKLPEWRKPVISQALDSRDRRGKTGNRRSAAAYEIRTQFFISGEICNLAGKKDEISPLPLSGDYPASASSSLNTRIVRHAARASWHNTQHNSLKVTLTFMIDTGPKRTHSSYAKFFKIHPA